MSRVVLQKDALYEILFEKTKTKLIVLSSSNIYFLCDQKIPCLHLNQPTCLLVYFFCNKTYLAVRIFFFFEKLFTVEQTLKVLKSVLLFSFPNIVLIFLISIPFYLFAYLIFLFFPNFCFTLYRSSAFK